MKNKKIVESWNKIKTDSTAHERILNNILGKVHSEKKRKVFYKQKEYRKVLIPAASCFVIVLAVIVTLMVIPGTPNGMDDFMIIRSKDNLYVRYINDVPELPARVAIPLTEISEDGLFNEVNTDIFSGIIQSVRNIEIKYNGYIQYRAIALISIEEVIRGSYAKGDIVSILLENTVNPDMQIEEKSVTSYMAAGMKGIFMPYRYDETLSIVFNDDVQLPYIELAQYGFHDGERFAFLETHDGVIFARSAYKSISEVQTLYEIEQYINTMLRH